MQPVTAYSLGELTHLGLCYGRSRVKFSIGLYTRLESYKRLMGRNNFCRSHLEEVREKGEFNLIVMFGARIQRQITFQDFPEIENCSLSNR